MSARSVPAGETGSLDTYITEAVERELAADPYWLALLHVQPGLFGASSLIDDPDFFLAPDGKHNPEAELIATLRGICEPVVETTRKQHAGYRFPARQAWLQEKLKIPDDALGMPEHEDLDIVLNRIRPEAVSLVYPFAYMNRPASMFGHTMLNLESGFDSELLNQAINYAALTDETNGIVFMLKGLFGGYSGFYHVIPYYKKVQEYNDINQRDIWVYPLNLSQAEVHRLMQHVWELQDIHADYFFFDENCSYQLLHLLDVARPGSDLASRARPWVIPLDTVRLAIEAGMTEQPRYRPSKASDIRHRAAQLTKPQLELALELSAGRTPWENVERSLPDDNRRALVLDLATEHLQISLANGAVKQQDYVPRFRRLLVARSKLEPADDLVPPIVAPAPPDHGHRSGRLSLGIGSEDDVTFGTLRVRPAYHDLLDADEGYLPGSQIEFLQAELRYYDSDRNLELQRLDLLTIRSYTPRDAFFQPTSWQVATGFVREPTADDLARQFYLNMGRGFTWEVAERALFYALLEGDLRAGDIEANYALGAGPVVGLLMPLTADWKLHARARYLNYPLGDEHERIEVTIGQRYRLSRHTAIGASYEYRRAHGDSWQTAVLEYFYYF